MTQPPGQMPAPAPWEKTGNTSWVQCRCDGWFHVSDRLLAAGAPPLHCPHCHAEFAPGDAARIEHP